MSDEQAIKLTPEDKPGRPNRKLLPYLGEIKRLRDEAYSVTAIHNALAQAGVTVGLTTVKLEVAKLAGSAPLRTAATFSPSRPPPPIGVESTGDLIDPPGETFKAETSTHPKIDIDAFFSDPLIRNPFLKGRLK